MSGIAEAYARRSAAPPSRGIGAAYAARFKEWDESLHPRVQGGPNAGEFTSADESGGLGDTQPLDQHPGTPYPVRGDRGYEGYATIIGRFNSFDDYRGAAEILKEKNAVRIGDDLVARAQDDPVLQAQLEAVGQRTMATATGSPASGTEIPTATATSYMTEHLGYSQGDIVSTMNPAEVGAREIAAKLQDSWMMTASDDSPLSWAMQIAVADKMGVDKQPTFDYLGGKSWMTNEGVSIGVPASSMTGPSEDMAGYVQRIADSPAMAAYVDQVYTDTQKQLEGMGLKSGEMILYRGVGFDEESNPFAAYHDQTTGDLANVSSARTPSGGVVHGTSAPADTTLNPLSSFSTDQGKALDFMQSQVEDHGGVSAGGIGYIISAVIPTERIFSYAETGPGCLGERELLVVGGPARVTIDDGGQGLTMTAPGQPTFPVGSDPASGYQKSLFKDFNEELHPRDERGRFTEGASTARSDEGIAGADKLRQALIAATTDAESAQVTAISATKIALTEAAAKEAKIGNVRALAAQIVEAAKTDPVLNAALTGKQPYERKSEEAIATGTQTFPDDPGKLAGWEKIQSVENWWRLSAFPGVAISGEHGTEPVMPEDKVQAAAQYWAGKFQSSWAGSASDGNVTSQMLQTAAVETLGATPSALNDQAFSDALVGRASTPGVAESWAREMGAQFPPPDESHTGGGLYQATVQGYMAQYQPVAEAFVQASYDRTQAFLKDNGIASIELNRGMHFGDSQGGSKYGPPTWLTDPITGSPSEQNKVDMGSNPLSSWSIYPATAERFARGTPETAQSLGVVLTATFPASQIFSLPLTGPGCLNEEEVLTLAGPNDKGLVRSVIRP